MINNNTELPWDRSQIDFILRLWSTGMTTTDDLKEERTKNSFAMLFRIVFTAIHFIFFFMIDLSIYVYMYQQIKINNIFHIVKCIVLTNILVMILYYSSYSFYILLENLKHETRKIKILFKSFFYGIFMTFLIHISIILVPAYTIFLVLKFLWCNLIECLFGKIKPEESFLKKV